MAVVYVPWLHMHQPMVWMKVNNKQRLVSNLYKMLMSKDPRENWDGKLIARAYKNPAKYVKQLKKEGFNPKIILDFSGILLESLENLGKEKFLDRIELEGEKIRDIIKLYKELLDNFPDSIEFSGTAYSHCYFPATPERDWILQIEEWRNVFQRIFGKKNLERVKGFWFPEMGVVGSEDKLSKLIELVSNYYEWCILPLQAIEGYESLSYEKRIQVSSQPHMLRMKNASIPVIFRSPTYLIDQQSGCELNELRSKLNETGRNLIKITRKPALVVPASDGENGNVLMNEFFPKTFVPFFKGKKVSDISSLTVTKFLHKYYEKNGKISPESEIKVKTIGASWINSHKFWLEGTRRLDMVEKLEKLSSEFWQANSSKGENMEEAKRALLLSETSCYVYWGTDFWFDQGDKTIKFAYQKIKELKK